MIKNILFFLLVSLFSLNLVAITYDKDIIRQVSKFEIPRGSPKETVIVVKNKKYLILHNPEAFAYETIKRQASSICGEINDNKDIKVTYSLILGAYTAYFVCGTGAIYSTEEKKLTGYLLEKDFIFDLREKHFLKIDKLEIMAEKSRIEEKARIQYSKLKFINELNKLNLIKNAVADLELDKAINIFIKRVSNYNKKICLNHGFKKDSDFYYKCLLARSEKIIILENLHMKAKIDMMNNLLLKTSDN
jgi:hypothetical protein